MKSIVPIIIGFVVSWQVYEQHPQTSPVQGPENAIKRIRITINYYMDENKANFIRASVLLHHKKIPLKRYFNGKRYVTSHLRLILGKASIKDTYSFS